MNGDDLRAVFAAYQQGDIGPLGDVLAADVVWTVPGGHRLAGEYSGLEEILGLFRRARELSGGTYSQQLVDVLTGDDRLVVLYRATGQRSDVSLDVDMLLLCVLAKGKVARLTAVPSDALAFAAFWA